MTTSFIEKQFPVSKISKESYKERKANLGQTLTGLGKWWGRKPLVLCRAAILGCILPATDNPERDMDIFLKLMSMDEVGLWERKEKRFTAKALYELISSNETLQERYGQYFDTTDNKIRIIKDAPKDEMEKAAFRLLGYDSKLEMCVRPENIENLNKEAWSEINYHYGTNANSLSSFIQQISAIRYGHLISVGDCFCGGGSIPFEAARIGCNAFGSDLNPIAGLLTWADYNICGGTPAAVKRLKSFMKSVYESAEEEIKELGIEENEKGDRAISYLYCVEAICPECKTRIPLAPSWVIGKGTKTVIQWKKTGNHMEGSIKSGATESELEEASNGTIVSNAMRCPCCGKTTPVSVIRQDRVAEDGSTIYGLRKWGSEDFLPHADDIFSERLYAVRYEDKDGKRYYRYPSKREETNEKLINEFLSKNIHSWQQKGYIPSAQIEPGYNTNQVMRERGWCYWHQLFTPRQLLLHGIYIKTVLDKAKAQDELVAGLLGINKLLNWDSKLCQWNSGASQEGSSQTFMNQALNTMWNWTGRGNKLYAKSWFYDINNYPLQGTGKVSLSDARDVAENVDLWITDPPYADAVNYHELSEFFISADTILLKKAFPEWYSDSKRILAVRGDEHFSHTMIDIYENLTNHLNDDGLQIVMFTHSDPAVWAQLALIMWKAGLTVTAAWNIATETDASGLKDGNYVKGTVLLVLRKQNSNEEAFLDELTSEIKTEVKKQISSMQSLDDKEDPNFSDPDYVLAAYAASLKVLTSYEEIGEINLEHELDLAIKDPSKSEVVKLIERAKKIAYDCIIPAKFDGFLWKDLTPAERFYIKGLEAEKHGNYQLGTYQEYARGFGLSNYGKLMGSDKPNAARLKTPTEFAMRTISEVEGFEESILRTVLAAIYVSIKEDDKPEKGLAHLKNNISGYWDKRDMLKQLLSYIADTRYIDAMNDWHKDAEMAGYIHTLVDNDHI